MIEFKNVSKTYASGTHALNNISLKIKQGEFVFVVGQSGAGKSTFLKLIMHEEVPSEGDIFVDEESLMKMRKRRVPYYRRKMGMVFQDFRLIEKMTVFDNVAFAMHVIGANNRAIKKRVPYILNLVGLSRKAKSKPSELSGGEQQRVSLARALVNNPKIIIADEPTGNVDPEMSHEIIELLSEINKFGTTVIIVTHEQELVEKFGRRVVEISKGRIIKDSMTGVGYQTKEKEPEEDEEEEENFITDEELQRLLNEEMRTLSNSAPSTVDRQTDAELQMLFNGKNGKKPVKNMVESDEIDLEKYDRLLEDD